MGIGRTKAKRKDNNMIKEVVVVWMLVLAALLGTMFAVGVQTRKVEKLTARVDVLEQSTVRKGGVIKSYNLPLELPDGSVLDIGVDDDSFMHARRGTPKILPSEPTTPLTHNPWWRFW
jgi:hypothetical protein